ncbi:DoxX family membrane protein [Pedobacter sp. GR22-6]|uniref:DoxX family membrane protein n=1 Tax=Pedobacter sp. GR22-6 TaxID=3127957 RepID=UPI00307EA39D
MKIVKTILFSLFALLFINAGLDKFFHYMPMPTNIPVEQGKDFAAFTEISWLMPLVGFAELVGGILIIIPRFRALGVLVIFPVLIGITLIACTVAQEMIFLPIVLLIILIWMIFDNKQKFLPLVK